MFITDLKNNLKILIFISLIGLLLRFLYFPSDVYFGYDQARDAYYIQDIIHGHLKVLGPPSTASSLYHGVLSYYILAPFYYLSEGNPLSPAIFIRVWNVLGIFLIFLIGSILVNRAVALLATFLFSISYEQTQYSLFFGHPSFGILSLLLFYLGLVLYIFKKDLKGLFFIAVGLGSSL